MRIRRWLGIAALAVAGIVCVTGVEAARRKATVTVTNQSDWEIRHFYLASVDTTEWGPDQLGDAVIRKGASFKLTDVPCDSYDVRIVDEDDDECVIAEVDICGGSESWDITSKDLLRCQASTN